MDWVIWVMLVFSSVGILDTFYLVTCKIKEKDVACWFLPQEWCRKVQHSEYSKTMGMPNSALGLAMNLLIFLLSIMFYKGIVSFWAVFVPIAIGFVFSMYFLYVQGKILRAYCTWCVLSAINFSVMFFSSLIYLF